MKTSRITAIFCLFTGCSITLLWVMLLATGQVSELITEPLRISLHLGSEFLLSALLIASGILWLRNSRHAALCYAFTCGMLVYSTINAAGYYAELSSWLIAAMLLLIGFAGLFLFLLIWNR